MTVHSVLAEYETIVIMEEYIFLIEHIYNKHVYIYIKRDTATTNGYDVFTIATYILYAHIN